MIQPRQKRREERRTPDAGRVWACHQEILAGVNYVQTLDPLIARTVSFLDKLAEYLMSDTYAVRSAKQIERKNRSIANRATTKE